MLAKLAHIVRVLGSKRRERLKAKTRSPLWKAARDRHLRAFSMCTVCGSTTNLQVHHIAPYRLRPDLELDPANLITLCMGRNECHHRVGHGWAWKFWVPGVKLLAMGVSGNKIPIGDAWQIARSSRQL